MSIINSTSSGYSSKSHNRILGFDIAKSLAMFLVILLHASFYTGIIRDSFFSRVMMSFTVICVPLFMAVNGAILLNKHFVFKRHLKKLVGIILLLVILETFAYYWLCNFRLSKTVYFAILRNSAGGHQCRWLSDGAFLVFRSFGFYLFYLSTVKDRI